MGLDYEFLESEDRFYKKYKEAVKEEILTNPIQFKSDALLEEYLFIGNILLPYLLATFILGVLYIGSLSFLINKSYKKYRLN